MTSNSKYGSAVSLFSRNNASAEKNYYMLNKSNFFTQTFTNSDDATSNALVMHNSWGS